MTRTVVTGRDILENPQRFAIAGDGGPFPILEASQHDDGEVHIHWKNAEGAKQKRVAYLSQTVEVAQRTPGYVAVAWQYGVTPAAVIGPSPDRQAVEKAGQQRADELNAKQLGFGLYVTSSVIEVEPLRSEISPAARTLPSENAD